MLDAQGNLLPQETRPRRSAPADAEPETYLDGSPAQFLAKYAPFPSGVSPHALAYDHFMKAYILQEYGGQRHVQKSVAFIDANPGRALRDWSISAFEEGRLLEIEAFGREATPPGESGRAAGGAGGGGRRRAADGPAGVAPSCSKRRCNATGGAWTSARDAVEWLNGHLRRDPNDTAVFGAAIRRLDALRPLLRADLRYDGLILGDEADSADARREVAALYRDADARLRDYLLLYHTPGEWLPGEMTAPQSLDLPAAEKNRLIDRLRAAAAADPMFVHYRAVTEFDGYLQRIRTRLALLGSPDAAATRR